jgi:hypothetical protein
MTTSLEAAASANVHSAALRLAVRRSADPGRLLRAPDRVSESSLRLGLGPPPRLRGMGSLGGAGGFTGSSSTHARASLVKPPPGVKAVGHKIPDNADSHQRSASCSATGSIESSTRNCSELVGR